MIKRFKTGLLTALLSLVALSSHADRLYVENTQMKAGGECDLNIMLEALNLSRCCAFQFDVVLPQGLETTIDNFKFYNTISGGAETEIIGKQLPNGTWRIMYYSLNNSILNLQTGAIGFIHVKGNASMEEKAHTGSIQNIVFTKLDANGSSTTMRVNANSFNVSVWREATVTARSYTRRYGEQNPVFEYDVTGGQLQGTPKLTCEATATTAVGTYDIKVAPGTVKNPYVTYVPGKLTIVSASSALVFAPVNKTYGDAAFTVSPKTDVSGGAITYSSNNTSVVMVSGQTFTIVGAGTATITANQAATANYGATSTNFTVTVGQREAVLSWSNLTFTYDGQSHVPTAKVQNLVGNDVCNVTVTGTQTNAGSYTATATALSNANYKLPAAKTNGFAVAKASLMIFGGNYVKKQGEPMPQWKAEYDGFVNGETEAVLTKQPLLSCDANENSAPGTYIVTVSGAEAKNYDISYQNGTLTVTAADQIVVTARSYSREYGDPNPTFEFNVTGGTLDGTPEIICDAVPKSPVNQYPIIIRKGSISNPNVQFVNGALTVTKSPLTITAKSYTITQGEPMPEFEADYSGFKLNDTPAMLTQQPQLSCAALDSSEPGTFAIRVYGSEARNYAIEEVDGVLTIVAAPQEPELVLTELYVDGDDHEAGQHTIHYTIRNYGGDFNDYVYIFLKVPGIDEVVKSGDFWSIPSKKELRVSKPATLTVFGTYHIWVATEADGQNILGETEWTLLQPEEEKGYTLVVKLKDGSEEKYVLKERPEAWPSGSQLRIQSTTVSTAYERSDIERFYFLDKDGNPSGIKAVTEVDTELTVRQLSNGRLQVSGLADGDAVRVFDLSGRLLNTVMGNGSNSLSIDLSQQPKGVYIININNKRTIKLQVK